MNRDLPRGSPWALLVLYGLLALGWSLSIPLGEAPDEPGHYNYARILFGELRLPRAEEEHEAFQPPLYYALAAPLAGLGEVTSLPLKANADFSLEPGGTANLLLHSGEEVFPWSGWAQGWHLVRVVSVVCGAVTVYGVYRLGLIISGRRREVALLGAAALVLAPQFTLVHGAASNDALTLALAALLAAELALVIERGCPRRRLVALGALWGLGILSKASMLAAGVGVAAALWLGRPRGGPGSGAARVGRRLLVVGGIAALVSGWWYVRNAVVFGDPLGWELIFQINEPRRGPVNWPEHLWGLHRSYWLDYVGMRLPEWLYVALLLPLALSVCGLAVTLARLGRRPGRKTLPLAVGLGTHVLAFAVSWMRWTLAVSGTGQARLLYPGLAVVAPFLAWGTLGVASGSRRRRLAVTAVGLLATLNVYGLLAGALPVFGPAQRVALSEVPHLGERIVFGGQIELMAFDHVQAVKAGGTLQVRTWWRLLTPVGDDVWLTLRLASASGEVPVWKRGSPTAGRDTTDRWPLGEALHAVHSLWLPEDLPAGTYTIEAGLQAFGEDLWWPAAGRAGETRELWRLGEVEVLSP